MKALLGLVGLVAIVIALAHAAEPPQPVVLIDVPAIGDPIDDLNLNGAAHALA